MAVYTDKVWISTSLLVGPDLGELFNTPMPYLEKENGPNMNSFLIG